MYEFCPDCRMSLDPDDHTERCLHCGIPLAEAAGSDHKSAGGFDPAFRPAVDEGLLTPGQAYARGKREACAARLSVRHGIPIGLAYEIADNRTSLTEALRERQARASRLEQTRQPAARGGRPAVPPGLLALGVLLLVATVVVPVLIDRRSDVALAELPGPTTIEGVTIDGDGRVLRIIGESPDDVLRSYCAHDPAESRLPLGVVRPASVDTPVRIGVLRDGRTPDDELAIAIRHDPHSDRWYAGDGVRVLEPSAAPPGATASIDAGR